MITIDRPTSEAQNFGLPQHLEGPIANYVEFLLRDVDLDGSSGVIQRVPFSGAGVDVLHWAGPGTLLQVVLQAGAVGSILVEDQMSALPVGPTVANLTTTALPETFLVNGGVGAAFYAGICLTIVGVNSGYLLILGA